MKLTQLSAKPVLIPITLDDQDILDEYKEPLEFHTYDRQPMDVFMKLVSVKGDAVNAEIISIVKTLILDENGNQILTDDNMLPPKVLIKAIAKVSEMLGK